MAELALVAAALGLHLALWWLGRRAPVWVARRTGTAPARWQTSFRLGTLAAKTLLWVAVALILSERLPELMAGRDRLAGLVARSFLAPLVRMGERAYSAVDLFALPLLLGALWVAVSLAMRGLRWQLARVGVLDAGAADSFLAVARYALAGLGAVVILQVWGVDLSALAIFGGVLGVGIGFGLQNIASNFVSGLVLSFERPIKPGDFVTLGEIRGTVWRIGARSTEIRTPDSVTVLVPNSRFLEGEVVNWSHGRPICKLHAPVGVAYGSDVSRVRAALLEAARSHPKVLAEPRPTVDLDGFGDSALLFDLEVWIDQPADQLEILSALNYRIEASLRRHGVAIPFPQRDLHLRSPELGRVLDAWSRRAFPELANANPEPAPHQPGFDPDVDADWAGLPLDDASLRSLVGRMRDADGVPIRDRRHLLAIHPRCFVGSEAVRWLVTHEGLSRAEAIAVGQRLVEHGLVRHVLDEHGFEDGRLFYRFHLDEASG